MPKAAIGKFVAYKEMSIRIGETRGVSKPNKWNEFSGIRKILMTCRTKWVLTKFILKQTPLLSRGSPRRR